MLQKVGYADSGLIDEVAAGFDLVGAPRFPGVFQAVPSTTLVDEVTLRSGAGRRSSALARRVTSSGSQEVDAGLLVGPFDSLNAVVDKLGSEQFVLSRRFPLRQGQKLRAIDDYSESHVNSAYASPFKLQLLDVDALAGLLSLLHDLVAGHRSEVTLSDGCVMPVR
eukprot:5417016-Amphidinium_carterae.1